MRWRERETFGQRRKEEIDIITHISLSIYKAQNLLYPFFTLHPKILREKPQGLRERRPREIEKEGLRGVEQHQGKRSTKPFFSLGFCVRSLV